MIDCLLRHWTGVPTRSDYKLKWCVENERGKEEIRIVTGKKAHLIDEYLKIMDEHRAALPP